MSCCDTRQGFYSEQGFKVSDGFPVEQGFKVSQGFVSGGDLFNGTYACYPFYTNGNNTITDGAKINTRLSDKNADNDAGNFETVPEYTTFFTGSGELDEPSATNIADPDLLNWTPRSSVSISSDTDDFKCIEVINTSQNQPMASDPASVGSLSGEQNFSVFARKGERFDGSVDDTFVLGIFQSTPSTFDSTAIFDLENDQVVFIPPALTGAGIERLDDDLWRVWVSLDVTAITGNITLKVKCTDSVDNNDYEVGTIRCAKFPNSTQGKTPSSYIDTLNGVRDSDKPTVPNSNAWVDPNHGLTGGGGIIPLAGTKYDGLLGADSVGAYFVDGNTIKSEILAAVNNEILVTDSVDNTLLSFQYSVYGDNNDLAGIKQLQADAGNTPPTQKIIGHTYQSAAPQVVISDNLATITALPTTALIDAINVVSTEDIKAGAYLQLELDVKNFSATGDGALNALGTVINTDGKHTVNVYLSSDVTAGVPRTIIFGQGTSGTISADVTITKFTSYVWLDWPTKNFTTSFKFTPLAFTGEGDALLYVIADSPTSQGYYMIVEDDTFSAIRFFVFNDGQGIPINPIVNVAGGMQIGTEYEIKLSVTDSTIYASIDDNVVSVPNTITFDADAWNAKIQIAGSSEAVYTCKIADLCVKDYQAPQDFANNGDFADNGDFA